jgi:hypothetical protein
MLSLCSKLNDMFSFLDSAREIKKNEVVNFTQLEQFKYEGRFGTRTDLNIKFLSLNNGTGNLDGLTLPKIVSVCGGYDIMRFNDNRINCAWWGVKYRIGISFDRYYKFLWIYDQEGSL